MSDNCPSDPNASQEDADLDLIGDVCDPFPDDRDNDQAQCEGDLAQCLAQGFPDADSDGVPDSLGSCADTREAAEVDQVGCSLEQFCASIDATTPIGKRTCKKSDWKNNEPIMRPADRDRTVDRGGPGAEDDRCVPNLEQHAAGLRAL